MKKNLLLLFYVIGFTGFSQDSLFFINKSVVAAKISEIGISDIKYHRFDNLTGPQYITNKSDIQYIKFENGKIDSIVSVNKTVVSVNSNPQTFNTYNGTQSNSSSSEPTKIEIKSNSRLAYNNRGLGERKFEMLIDNFPNLEGKLKLQNEWKTMKKYKAGQFISGFVGLGLGLATPLVGIAIASSNSYGSSTEQTLQTIGIGIGSGVVLGVTGATISTIFKSKRNKKKVEIARMYNDMR